MSIDTIISINQGNRVIIPMTFVGAVNFDYAIIIYTYNIIIC